MLQVFYMDVAYACNGFQEFSNVLQVLQTHVASVKGSRCPRGGVNWAFLKIKYKN
jgi:CxxC motif-containing protein